MSLEIRILGQDDVEAVRFLMAQAFSLGDRPSDFPPDQANFPHVAYGAFDAGGVQASAVLLALKMHLGPDLIAPLGGVAGVASAPASRGRGYAAALIHKTLEAMRESGQYVSALNPFNWDFYRQLGWDWVGVGRTYTVSSRILRPDPETESVRTASAADTDAFRAVYRRHAGRYRGPLDRTEHDWETILAHTEKKYTFSFLYVRDGEPQGYIVLRALDRKLTRLREFVALTPEAYRALLGLLRRHAMQTESLEWAAPDDDPLWHHLMHFDVHTKIRPITQARIVDVPAALGALRAGLQEDGAGLAGHVNIAVRDEAAPWNDGIWRVEAADGAMRAQQGREAAAVEIGIQSLSQAFFGTPLHRIREAAGLRVHDEGGYAMLRRMLAGPAFWMNDYF